MKKSLLLLVLGLVALPGCSRHYVMKLSNGVSITTASKPRLKGSNYYYRDASGRQNSIAQGRVLEILPASMAKKEKSPFIPSSK